MSEQTAYNRHTGKQKGFTLVELIVVLAILSILASVGVMSLIGYIDKARFDNNEQNAQNIYQAVQTALVRKKNSGEMEKWITETLMVKGTQDPYDTSSKPNNDKDAQNNVLDTCFDQTAFDEFDAKHNSVGESVHMRYVLTYQKGGNGTDNDNKDIQELVGGYFYDTSILNATFTIEFDVEKTIGGDERLHYAVNTYAVFYDEKRIEWDHVATNDTSSVVPWREYAYRSDTSLIGYYNGGNPAAVDSVYTPLINKKMEFAELAMRNGEKLELSFSVMYDGQNVTGKGLVDGKDTYIHYTASIYDTQPNSGEFTPNMQDDKWLADLVISEAYLTSGRPDGRKPVDYMSALKFDPKDYGNGSVVKRNIAGKDYDVLYTVDRMTDDTNKPFVRYKASIETTALVYVNTADQNIYDSLTANDLTEAKFYKFPLTISYVRKDYANSEPKEYISYSITLDAMMSRYAEYTKDKNTGLDKTLNYSITRFFIPEGKYNNVNYYAPKNIRVAMTASVDAFTDKDLAEYNLTTGWPDSENVNAKRAYDDPVYFVEDGKYEYREPKFTVHENGKRVFKDPEKCATRDYAGYAVCNTLFGDLGYGSFGNKYDYVDRGKNNIENNVQLASITSYRHLYNMRYTRGCKYQIQNNKTKPVVYEIQRDLDWYRKIKDTQDDYTSEVVVYGFVNNKLDSQLVAYSPVGYSRGVSKFANLKIVSWPALPELSANQILVAVDNTINTATGDRTSVIRNVQMRRQSFLSTDKKGIGLICTNNGTIRNIRCENLCLVLETVVDGITDTARVPDVVQKLLAYGESIDQDYKYKLRPKGQEQDLYLGGGNGRGYIPIGGLIGEQNGSIGEEGLDLDQNTIRMSNTIVLAGGWNEDTDKTWKIFKMFDGTGGVVGLYSSGAKSYGNIETCGSYAVAGCTNVGGVIGQVKGRVDAHLIVNSEKGDESKKAIISFPNDVQALVIGRNIIGGAVGYVDGGCFAQDATTLICGNNTDGVFTIDGSDAADYAIDVHLAENTYVWQFGRWHQDDDPYGGYNGIGGVIGQINSYKNGMMLSVRAENKGYVLSGNTGSKLSGRYVGGAIGYLKNSSVGNLYIYAQNKGMIGTKDGVNPFGKGYAAAAGIACIQDSDISGGFVMDVINEGIIACDTNNYSNTNPNFFLSEDEYKKLNNETGKQPMGHTGVGVAIGAYVSKNNEYPTLQIRAVNSGTILAKNQNQADSGIGGAVGYLYALQNGSHIYSLQEETAVLSADGKNVGGAVGCIRGETKGTNAKPVTIAATIMNSTGVKGTGDNVGGCVGDLRQLKDYTNVYAHVMTDSGIYGCKNVGGVVGSNQLGGDTAGTSIVLKGSADAPRLTIYAQEQNGSFTENNINAGGCIGMSGYNGTGAANSYAQ